MTQRPTTPRRSTPWLGALAATLALTGAAHAGPPAPAVAPLDGPDTALDAPPAGLDAARVAARVAVASGDRTLRVVAFVDDHAYLEGAVALPGRLVDMVRAGPRLFVVVRDAAGDPTVGEIVGLTFRALPTPTLAELDAALRALYPDGEHQPLELAGDRPGDYQGGEPGIGAGWDLRLVARGVEVFLGLVEGIRVCEGFGCRQLEAQPFARVFPAAQRGRFVWTGAPPVPYAPWGEGAHWEAERSGRGAAGITFEADACRRGSVTAPIVDARFPSEGGWQGFLWLATTPALYAAAHMDGAFGGFSVFEGCPPVPRWTFPDRRAYLAHGPEGWWAVATHTASGAPRTYVFHGDVVVGRFAAEQARFAP